MPKSVIFLIFLVAFVEFVLQLGQKGLIGEQASIGWRMELIQKYGFFDAIFEWMRDNNAYKFNNDITNSKLIVMQQSGHVPMEEKPIESLKFVIDFLNN